MNILQINAVNKYSSTGRTTFELHTELLRLNYKSYIAFSETIDNFDSEYKIGNKFNKKVHALMSRISGKQAYFSKKDTLKLLNYLDFIKPDIVHLRNLHANYININILLKYLSDNDIPTVITLHDCWFFTGGCTYYTDVNCNRWQSECGKCPMIGTSMSWFVDSTKDVLQNKEKLISGLTKLAIIGVSDWITSEAKKSILKNAKVVKRIYNWVDLDVFKPGNVSDLRIFKEVGEKFIILGVAQRWNTNKGLEIFKELAKIISDDAIIMLVGEIEDTNLPSNIVSLGSTSDVQKLSEYYSMANVFVNPSIQETFGKVTAEALASGTPAIVRNTTANPEIVGNDEKCGYVLDDMTAKSIWDKINLIKNKHKSHFTYNCRSRAEYLFNKEKCINEYLYVYQQLTKN